MTTCYYCGAPAELRVFGLDVCCDCALKIFSEPMDAEMLPPKKDLVLVMPPLPEEEK